MTLRASHLRVIPGNQADTATADKTVELEVLFREHYDRVYRTACRVTGSGSDAEDVLQTVFLRLVRRDNVDLSPNPAAYLTRAAVNAALDIVRARQSARAVSLEEMDVSQEPVSLADSPAALHEDQELRRLIRRSIGKMSQNAAEMFVLRYFEGYDNHEIARLMGTSHLVVGVLLHRVRTKLRKEIGKYLETA
ncbi:MAG: RNA polymerase sigma factor [Blastocatellia bacterium]